VVYSANIKKKRWGRKEKKKEKMFHLSDTIPQSAQQSREKKGEEIGKRLRIEAPQSKGEKCIKEKKKKSGHHS